MSDYYELIVQSSIRHYPVRIASHHGSVVSQDGPTMLVVDDTVASVYPAYAHGFRVKATESCKTLDSVARMIEALRDHGATRETHLWAVGGGIIQDVSTFFASVYMRGIQWTYVPTTLLGMVDSCIGGKSSLNVGPYKNIAGNFYPPHAIIVNPLFCRTLSRIQLIDGLCEAVKICFAGGDASFQQYRHLFFDSVSSPLSDSQLSMLIQLSLETKKTVIEQDEFDQGPRLMLNFGHTFGHALEGATRYQITHGVAVGLGILMAIEWSHHSGLCDRSHPRVAALWQYLTTLLMGWMDRPPHTTDLLDTVWACFESDKKHTATHWQVIACQADGSLARYPIPKTTETQRMLYHVIDRILTAYL